MNFCYFLLLAAITSCQPVSKDAADTAGNKAAAEDSSRLQEHLSPAGKDSAGKSPPDSTLILGKKIYDSYCLACHQSDGNGVPGMYPPLTDTAWLADEEKLIEIVLEGLSGSITVNGKTYNQMMPTHNFLKDKEIASVLSYVRYTFGDNKDYILPEEVSARREN
ncbi:mono/diheme cytochrome c family protein [Anseongella ginsenosidimutans]|uniref:Mono/diheme cytochrome c family protein n=1 Tax=Anseongella ginsenosidimutans TaxID=496056 RepID=A0A4R3KPX6_9SPHI|nr:cytochrome c [Anseongella ginsenosidimutans]TCS86571.1 mono/diheme cytochrome c family protein [Anseongella ginsenosidimutans]